MEEASPSKGFDRRSRVSLVGGTDRYENVSRALSLIEGDVSLKGISQILIKPNFTSVTEQLAATHVDAVRALLDFLRERTCARIVIAEGSGTGAESAMVGFHRFGYLALRERYDITFLDLNKEKGVEAQIFDHHSLPLKVRIAKAVVESDYRISICPPKTHDFVVVTGSLKNLIMGSLLRGEGRLLRSLIVFAKRLIPKNILRVVMPKAVGSGVLAKGGNDKIKMHQGYPMMNINLARLAKVVHPELSVIDGFQAMEGDGPVAGKSVDLRMALASTDFLAADVLAAKVMGFEVDKIGYLFYCHGLGLGQGDLSRVEVVGESMEACTRSFEPHPLYRAQIEWDIADPFKYLDLEMGVG